MRYELTGATNLTGNPEEIEETWIEVKRRRRTADREGQEESTDGSDLRQDGWVEDVPADDITK